MSQPTIGVLALQGDVREHLAALPKPYDSAPGWAGSPSRTTIVLVVGSTSSTCPPKPIAANTSAGTDADSCPVTRCSG